eukprot:c12348_g1_i1.p3 GENE.c12348_g1_i1~~c12348_g1_i1.p3  ORF type:complete len:103 (+),score=5.97 c12348_g1_i1:531-839(+)
MLPIPLSNDNELQSQEISTMFEELEACPEIVDISSCIRMPVTEKEFFDPRTKECLHRFLFANQNHNINERMLPAWDEEENLIRIRESLKKIAGGNARQHQQL